MPDHHEFGNLAAGFVEMTQRESGRWQYEAQVSDVKGHPPPTWVVRISDAMRVPAISSVRSAFVVPDDNGECMPRVPARTTFSTMHYEGGITVIDESSDGIRADVVSQHCRRTDLREMLAHQRCYRAVRLSGDDNVV
jgi:hypothetical protein